MRSKPTWAMFATILGITSLSANAASPVVCKGDQWRHQFSKNQGEAMVISGSIIPGFGPTAGFQIKQIAPEVKPVGVWNFYSNTNPTQSEEFPVYIHLARSEYQLYIFRRDTKGTETLRRCSDHRQLYLNNTADTIRGGDSDNYMIYWLWNQDKNQQQAYYIRTFRLPDNWVKAETLLDKMLQKPVPLPAAR